MDGWGGFGAANAHVQASLGAVTGSDYMLENWLACYAVLYLSGA
jgi:hypothetical protein